MFIISEWCVGLAHEAEHQMFSPQNTSAAYPAQFETERETNTSVSLSPGLHDMFVWLTSKTV